MKSAVEALAAFRHSGFVDATLGRASKKTDYFLGCLVLFGIVCAFVFAIAYTGELRDRWVFNHMTGAEHLWEAKKGTPDLGDVRVALRHLSAIAPGSPEAAEAKAVGTALRQRESELNVEVAHQEAAQTERVQATSAATIARKKAAVDFGKSLKEEGYEVTGEASSEVPNEVVLTSELFTDTDQRVKFLAVIRKDVWETAALCYHGFTNVRLRSSKIPLLGFNESYSLNCSR